MDSTKQGYKSHAICDIDDFIRGTYDFVIVGGGTAGLVLAARLTENPSIRVGVIEAGKSRLDDPNVNTPAGLGSMVGNPDYDWRFMTVPQRGNKDLIHHMSRGKVLGGSSAMNGMMYVRGSKADYDDWAEFGPGWSWDEMWPYFRKHQTLDPFLGKATDREYMPHSSEYHGSTGPIHTSFNDWRIPLEDDIIDAFRRETLSTSVLHDPWSGDHIGFYSSLVSVDRSQGTRSYSANGYLEPNLHRKNLRVLTEALACSIILEQGRAAGVSFSHGGTLYKIPAMKEVLVCCGTYQSPQLLELSGIGDPEVLEPLGLECLVPLPGVGARLQDHVLGASVFDLADDVMSLDSVQRPENLAEHMTLYETERTGALAAAPCCMGFVPYASLVSDSELQQTCELIEETASASDEFQQKQYAQTIRQLKSKSSANIQIALLQVKTDIKSGVADQSQLIGNFGKDGPDGLTIAVALQYPVSRGTVHITSTDPAAHPQIDPAYLTHQADVAIMAAGLELCQKVTGSPLLQEKLRRRIDPDESVDLRDRNQASDAIRERCMTEYHPCGTCAMGDVVDERLRVKGCQGLRVVDASIFPSNLSGNIMSSVYAVAEKAADLIKEDHERVF